MNPGGGWDRLECCTTAGSEFCVDLPLVMDHVRGTGNDTGKSYHGLSQG